LVEAAENGLISFYAAAEEANLITRRPPLGTGSANMTRTRMWAMAKVTGQAPRLASKPDHRPDHPQPLPSEIRAIIEKLVAAGRADLICDVAEYKLTPFQAEAIVDRDERARKATSTNVDVEKATDTNVSVEKRTGKRKAVPAEPEKPKIDVRCLIA
jgi:hypothetical protein